MKKCVTCNETKQEEEFGKDSNRKDGLKNTCKKCRSIISKKSKLKNRESVLEKSRIYANKHYTENKERERERHKKWIKNNPEKYKESCRKTYKKSYENNKDKILARNKKWKDENKELKRESDRNWRINNLEKAHERVRLWKENNPERVTALNKEYYKKYPEKFKARRALSYAVEGGKIVRPTICSRCNEEGYIEGHHYDYSKPLEVIWLCRKCHAKEHLTLNKRK